jgi:site-specific recombinase XerD
MRQELINRPVTELSESAALVIIPGTVADAGEQAAHRFFEFFTANIRNPNTRAAYHRAACRFFGWCEERNLAFERIRPPHVAAFIEELGQTQSRPSVKQALAAIRMLFDFLVVGQVIPMNPASPVRGPSYSTKKGKTAVLTEEEARQLLSSIKVTQKVNSRELPHVVGLRDRALLAVMVYGFARVGAVVAMNVEDYFPQGKRWWFRLHEKGGKYHEMPAHHKAEEYLDAYLEAARLSPDKKGPLFRTAAGKTGRLTAERMTRNDAYRMVLRRATAAGIETRIGCHTFRATGITNYLENGGSLEKAQAMANHESARTTKLYDRRDDRLSLDEVERISI